MNVRWLCLTLFTTTPAFALADEAEPAEPPAPPPASVDAEDPPAKAPKKKPVVTEEEEEEEEDWGPDIGPPRQLTDMERDWEFAPRFRSGVSATVNIFVPGPVYLFGLEGRSGFQANDILAGYFSAGVAFGFSQNYLEEEEASFESSFGGLGYVNLMGEGTFFDTLFVALGPQLAFGAIVQTSTYLDFPPLSATSDASVFAGLMPGARMRLGIGFGTEAPRRRGQFTFGVDASLLIGESFRVQQTATETKLVPDGIAAGVMPTFFLGFDNK